MHATLAGLVHGCAEALEDNAPRLILADWLEDHGQPERAEFVRLQCRLADWVPDWQERQALVARQEALLAQHRNQWLGGLAESAYFMRGLCRLIVSGETFRSSEFGAAFVASNPTALVEQVRITGSADLGEIAACPWLGQVPALDLGQTRRTAAELAPLWSSPHLRVVDLDLSDNGLAAESVQHLLAVPWFGHLARLGVRNNALTEATLGQLLKHAPATLRDLDVAGNELTSGLVARLADHLPANRRRNPQGLEFVRVPAGSFLMGSVEGAPAAGTNEQPQHAVTLSQPFWLGRFAVTQAQYQALIGRNPANFAAGPLTLPIETVNYADAKRFCKRLPGNRDPRLPGPTYRLPTEAEWEYAARAGTFTPYWYGTAHSLRWMNYIGGALGEPEQAHQPLPVGSFPPNPFGLYEMHGNIWEWCSDYYADNYVEHGDLDPIGPAKVSRAVVRGGCWDAHPMCCRSAHRYGETLTRRDRFTGFRVVLVEG